MPEPRRIAQIVRLKPECLQSYKDCHREVWPAVLEQIKDCNLSDYSIFFDDTSSTLFASMKWNGQDFEADMEKMRSNPKVQQWWSMTDGKTNIPIRQLNDLANNIADMQQSLIEGSTGSTDPKGWWKELEEVFRFD